MLHTLGPERREALLARHPGLLGRPYPERLYVYLRSHPDPFDTLAPALRDLGWVVADVVLDDPGRKDAETLRRWIRDFSPDGVFSSEGVTGLWSPRAAAFMDRDDVSLRRGVLHVDCGDAPVSLVHYAAFGRARVVRLGPGVSDALGRAAVATGAVVLGPAAGAPWPTYRDEAEASALVARALRDDERARAWVEEARERLLEERRHALAVLVARGNLAPARATR